VEIQRERAVRYAQMIHSLEDIKPGKLARDLSSLAETIDSTGAEQQRRLRARMLARARRLDAAVEEAGALYAFDRLHTVRIAAKKLRYALELVQELTRLGTSRVVGRVKHVQDLLGRLHDLEVLAAYVRRAGNPSPNEPAVDVSRLLQAIEQETRQLHAEYLVSAPTLQAVTAACREEIAPRLG
jgi:CHAD domain-containing protein